MVLLCFVFLKLMLTPYQLSDFTSLLNSTSKTSTAIVSRSPEDFISQHQTGGTATILCKNWVSRLTAKCEDLFGLGRWSFITVRGKEMKLITIITAYNVMPTTGETTNCRQQQCTLTSLHQQHSQQVFTLPHRQFILDLQAWLETIIASNHKIILAMDASSTYNPDETVPAYPLIYKQGVPTVNKNHSGALATLVSTCGLHDPFARQHSSLPLPASHIHGSEQIDFIFVSLGISNAITSSGCLSFHSVFNTNHRAQFLDFDSMALFADPAYEISPQSQHRLQHQDPRLVDQYKSHLHKQLEYHKVMDKPQQLQEHASNSTWTNSHTEEYYKLDVLVTEAMLHNVR